MNTVFQLSEYPELWQETMKRSRGYNDVHDLSSAVGDSLHDIVEQTGVGKTPMELQEQVVHDIGIVFEPNVSKKNFLGYKSAEIIPFPVSEKHSLQMLSDMIQSLHLVNLKDSKYLPGIINMTHKEIIKDKENIFHALQRTNGLGDDVMYGCLKNIFQDKMESIHNHLKELRVQERRSTFKIVK